ncbi:MAG: hypothetical protein O3A01_06585 [bacterium]|nr:hypothetical protein [bacterium]
MKRVYYFYFIVTGLSIQLTVFSVLFGVLVSGSEGDGVWLALFLTLLLWPIGAVCTWIGNKGMQITGQSMMVALCHVPLVLVVVALLARGLF